MGGRGSSYGLSVVQAKGNGMDLGEIQELNVVGMTPMDQGSRFTSAEKTLSYLEGKKRMETKEQLQVLDEHGYVTRAFQGDEHSVSVDASTRKYMKDKIVTHNHPSAFGGTFSDADINSLRLGMKELRASAREGTYSIKREKNADPPGFMKAYNKDAPKLQEKMKEIAKQEAKKKYSSKEAYEKENRRRQLEVIHQWYTKNASTYGYSYSFDPDETYK